MPNTPVILVKQKLEFLISQTRLNLLNLFQDVYPPNLPVADQWQIHHFPDEGANLLFSQFYRKMHENVENLAERRLVPCAPRSANG